MVKSNEEALRELLRLMADNPGLADRTADLSRR